MAEGNGLHSDSEKSFVFWVSLCVVLVMFTLSLLDLGSVKEDITLLTLNDKQSTNFHDQQQHATVKTILLLHLCRYSGGEGKRKVSTTIAG